MTQHLFDLPEEERLRKIVEMLLQHHADIQRLWKRVNQHPRDWAAEQPHAADALTPPQDDIEAT